MGWQYEESTFNDMQSQIESLRQQLAECEAKVKWMEGNTPNWGWPWDAPFTDGYETAKDEFRERIVEVEQQLAECERERELDEQRVADLMDQVAKIANERDLAWSINPTKSEQVLETQLATVTAERDELVAALSSIRECVFAAMFEGLQDRLAEEENTDAGSLYDLVMRRLLPMDAYAEAALAKLGADKTGEKG